MSRFSASWPGADRQEFHPKQSLLAFLVAVKAQVHCRIRATTNRAIRPVLCWDPPQPPQNRYKPPLPLPLGVTTRQGKPL